MSVAPRRFAEPFAGRTFFRVGLCLALASVLLGCPPKIDTGGDGGDGPIITGPEGGLFIRNGFAINIPKGAISANDTVITVTIIDTGIPEVPTRKRISFGYRFSPTNLKFASPATIYLPWIDERVPKAVDPGTFDMRRQAGSDAYLQLPGAKTNTDPFQAVEAQTERLGLFWVTSPSEPNVSRLEISPAEVTLRVGDTQQYTAMVVDPTGAAIEATVTWAVAPPRVASVDSAGLLTATGAGTATVTAHAGQRNATAVVHVVGNAVGPSTFVHQNPFPTGNDLWGGALAPGGLGTIFVGANATVLARSATDQWTRLFSSPGMVLKAVGGTTVDNAVAVGRANNSGVLVQFKGASAAPAVTVYDPRSIGDLDALWFDGTSGMAVGEGNNVAIFRGGRWETEYHPSFERLMSVVGDGAGSFVVVGNLGSIYRWDPARKVWDSLYQTRLSVLLTAGVLVDSAGSEAWAVGGNRLWHFQGGAWTAANLPGTPALTEATALGLFDHRVVIGGRQGAVGTILVHDPAASLDGGTGADWVSTTLRLPQIPRGVFGGGAASTTGYVVGDYGAVWQWRTATADFVEVSKGFYGDVADLAVLSTDVFAAVNECATASCTTRVGKVMHQGAAGFEPLGPQAFTEPVFAIVAKSATEVLVSTTSAIWKWDGATWSEVTVQGGLSGPVLDLKYCGNAIYGAGVNGAWYRGTPAQITNSGSLLSQGDLAAVYCPSDTEIWIAGDGLLASRIAGSTWTPRDDPNINQAGWRAVWGPGGGEAFAFGAANYGVYWDTTQLQAVQALGGISPDLVTGMWGSSIDNLYMVGVARQPATFGFALRYDGIQWQLVDSGSQRTVTAIDGSGPVNIWVGTEGGGILKAVAP